MQNSGSVETICIHCSADVYTPTLYTEPYNSYWVLYILYHII